MWPAPCWHHRLHQVCGPLPVGTTACIRYAVRPPVQVELADLVVVNKCDLASLIELASVEDLVLKISPGVRCMRARFGQVRRLKPVAARSLLAA
eukprot:362238-Chlamydomonas_euryale.AAC.3